MGKGIGKTSKRGAPRARLNSRGETTWQVRYRIDGRASSKTFIDERRAEAFAELLDRLGPAEALRFTALDSSPRPVKGPTVAQWCEAYIEQLTKPAAGTRQKYRRYVANDIADTTLGRTRVRAVCDGDVKAWVNAMVATGAAKGTIQNKQRFLSGALNYAVTKGLREDNPARGVAVPDSIKRAPVFLTPQEFATLVAEIPQRYKGLIEFLAESGCRWGEAVALQPHHVDRAESTVHIQQAWHHQQGGAGYDIGPTKTARSDRVIAIRPVVLEKVLADMADGQQWLFTNQNLDPVRANTFNSNTWYPALDRLALPRHRRPRIHDLRHTHASWLMARGVPILDVSRRLGHASIQTTANIYGHLAPGSADAIMAALDDTRGK